MRALRRPSIEELVMAVKAFPPDKGLGWDAWHPRALLVLPRCLLSLFIDMIMLTEHIGEWPVALGQVVIPLLNKPCGGLRPIGLFPSLPRIRWKMRRAIGRGWETANERSYQYGGRRKGAQVAAQKMAMRAEIARAKGDNVAQALLDLAKCFEYVEHWVLAREAAAAGYSLVALRASIQAYLLLRVIVIQGVCSRILCATRGITAGSGPAVVELRVVLMRALDAKRIEYPMSELTVIVDDITIEAVGPRQVVVNTVTDATNFLCALLREKEIGVVTH